MESCSAATTLLKALLFIYLLVNQCSEKGWEKKATELVTSVLVWGLVQGFPFKMVATETVVMGQVVPEAQLVPCFWTKPSLYLLCCPFSF